MQMPNINAKSIKTRSITARLPAKFVIVAAAALTAMLAAAPRAGRAQGIVRGAQEGAYEGNRVAGPVGGVVGGAVGAGVGGAVGAVEGVLGVPHHSFHHHYRCRGYYDSYGYYRCFH